jgi:hypothetical protein
MKNLKSLATKREIHDFMGACWRSQPFRRSYLEGGFVFDQVERFAWLPRLFAETSNDHLERAHFSTWWNVIMIRDDYDNPIIHDLYYLHEMAHAASMPYIDGIGRAAFDEKMQRNELEASVLSEIAVYFEMPGLREASFDHEIYADRFLNDPNMQNLWRNNREVALETLRSMRRDVMVSKAEHQMDLTEVWIRRFADQNAAYSVIWADRYGEIEKQMSWLQSSAHADRSHIIRLYRGWLEQESAKDIVDNIPFRQEAELFAPFYWSNKTKYSSAMTDAS